MKRRLILLLAFMVQSMLSFSQVQRLALLPEAMRVAGSNLSSLCIDLFRDAPKGQSYGEIGSDFQYKYKAPNLSSVHAHPGESLPADLSFLGHSNEAIPAYYQDFLKATIDKYKDGLDEEKYQDLQANVWAYDGMNHLGWINRTADDQLAEFEAKKSKFAFRYDVVDETSDAAQNKAISDKALQLHVIAKYADQLAAVTDVRLSATSITCREAGELRSIGVHYDGADYRYIAHSPLVATDLNKYIAAYRTLPDEASVTAPSRYSNTYVLSFAADANLTGEMRANFNIPTDRAGEILKMLGALSPGAVCVNY